MSIPKNICLSCFNVLYDENPQYQPKEGDKCVCVFCGNIMELDENLKFRKPKPKKVTKEMLEASLMVKVSVNLFGADFVDDFIRMKNKEQK